MLTHLAHIALGVSDMEKSLDFYCGLLGLTKAFELHDDNDQPWIIYLKISDGQFIELFYNAKGPVDPYWGKAGYQHFCFGVDDIWAFTERLHSRGLYLDKNPTMGKDTNYQIWVKDPDGVDIEIMQLEPTSPQAKA